MTLSLDLAGEVGEVRSIAKPDDLDRQPIGVISDADACEVFFEKLDACVWIMTPLLMLDDRTDGDGRMR